MPQLANALSGFTDRVVIDRTALPGRFNADLQWTTDVLASATAADAATDVPPALVTAIREQLGLKLQPTTAPVEVLVIESASRPTPN
jgi:uncharacterized protein (TIGR03435 family)